MLPLSREPRAKMKVTFRQMPSIRSLDVSLVWRSWIGSGEAVIAEIRTAMVATAWNFMLQLNCRLVGWVRDKSRVD